MYVCLPGTYKLRGSSHSQADLLGSKRTSWKSSADLMVTKFMVLVLALEWVLVDSVSGGFVNDLLFFLECRSGIKIILITESQFTIYL